MWMYPRVQTWSRLPGTVWRGLIFFMTDRPHYHRMPPLSGDNHGWVVSAVRTGCAIGHRATTIRASITSPRSLFRPRTQQVWWDHREKSLRASTLWDCRGKSRQTGPDVNAGYMYSRLDPHYTSWNKMVLRTHLSFCINLNVFLRKVTSLGWTLNAYRWENVLTGQSLAWRRLRKHEGCLLVARWCKITGCAE